MKKIFSVVLSICLLLSSLSITAFATDSSGLVVSSDRAKPGEEFTLNLHIEAIAETLSTFQYEIDFDYNAFELKEYTAPDLTGGSKMTSIISTSNTNGKVTATYTGSSYGNDIDMTAGFTATMKFAVRDSATTGSKTFTLTKCGLTSLQEDGYTEINRTPASLTSSVTLNVVSEITGEQAISITAPVKGGTPQSTIAEGTGYTGTISWSPTVSSTFAGDTVYTATVELTAKSGYQFASTATASVSGATISEKAVESDGSKLKFKAAFPATAGKETPTCVAPSGVTATYGQTLSDLTLSNTSGNTPGAWSWMNGTQSVGNVGSNTHKAKFTPTDTANFLTVENIDVTVTVNAKSLSDVSIDNIDDQAYTGSPITPTVTVKGDSGKTLVTDTDYTVEYSNNTNKGTATVTVMAKSGGNYTFSNVTKDFNIVAAASTISITSDPSKTYDGAAVTDPTVDKSGSTGAVTYAYYKNADCTTQTGTADGAASNGAAPKNAGSYWVKASVAADANYGAATSAAKSFTISPKNISGANITLGTAPTYDGSEQSISISSVTLSGGPAITSGDYDITTGTDKATNVESKTLTIKGTGNFTGTATKTWSLQKATPTTSDFTISTDLTKDYTGSPITVSAPTSSKNGIGVRTVKYAGSTTAPTDVGTYTVTFDVAEGQNYTAATGLSIGTLTINKVDYTGTKTASATVRSGQVNTDVTLTLPALPAGASYGTVSASGDLIDGTPTVSGTTLTYSTTSQTDGTTATITIGVTGATNYNNYDVVVTVTAKDKENAGVTIADSTKTVTYGSNVTVAASATATGGTWSWNYPSDTFEAVGATNGASISLKPLKATTGAATVTAKYESETHIGEATASVTVGKKNVTITGLSASSKEYDGNTTATVNGTAVVSGKVGSDDVTVTAGTAAFANKSVGNNKTVTFSGYSLSGAAAGNYNLTAQPDSVTANITAKPVAVTVTATDRDYVSGNRNVVLVAGSVTGAIGGDTVNVDVSGATGTLENEDAGTDKAVTVTGVALSGADAGNYNLTAQPTGVTVTINKKNYDGSITGNKNVHTNQAQTGVTFDMSEKFGVIKGAAVKSASEGTDSDNLIDNVSVDGNVVKFDVASIADAGKTATINVVISCTNFNDITAVLTVKTVDKDEAGVTISGVPAEAKTYGDADLTLTASAATPGANGTWTWETNDSSVLQLTPNGNKVTVKLLKVGKATVTAKYESDTTIGQLTTANIRVEKATITVAAKNQSIYVNGTVPDLTSPVKDTHYTVTGLAAGDTLGGTLTMKYQKDGVDATPDATKTGTYDIVISGATAPAGGNYNDVVFTAGTLTLSNRPSSGGGGVSTYSITAEPTEHGTISVSPKNASKGTTVTVTVKPDEGYELDALTVANGSGKAVTVTEKDGKYTFTMPASKVSVKATFKEAEKPVTMPFADVESDDWFYEDVQYVYSKGMMVGTKEDQFTPHATTTRGMIITILYRLEGEPTVSGLNAFDDVAEGEWYSAAVKWAVKNEIVGGYGNGKFGPEDVITREQMAVILYRYAAFKGQDMTKAADLSKFTDNGEISGYAVPSLGWANAEGLVSGKGSGILDPLGSATRAEAAAILHRFCENMVK